MEIKLQSGAVIVCNNPDIIEQHLKYGGVEVTKSTPVKDKKSKSVNITSNPNKED